MPHGAPPPRMMPKDVREVPRSSCSGLDRGLLMDVGSFLKEPVKLKTVFFWVAASAAMSQGVSEVGEL
jgi:hypothetical protein